MRSTVSASHILRKSHNASGPHCTNKYGHWNKETGSKLVTRSAVGQAASQWGATKLDVRVAVPVSNLLAEVQRPRIRFAKTLQSYTCVFFEKAIVARLELGTRFQATIGHSDSLSRDLGQMDEMSQRGARARLGMRNRASIRGTSKPSLIPLGMLEQALHFLTHRASELFLHSLCNLNCRSLRPYFIDTFAYSVVCCCTTLS
jgi:hypothetical protein